MLFEWHLVCKNSIPQVFQIGSKPNRKNLVKECRLNRN